MTTQREEELWDKAIQEAKTNWVSGILESEDQGHCALGCLAYAKWGTKWSQGFPNYTLSDDFFSAWDYQEILTDPEVSVMGKALAQAIKENHPDNALVKFTYHFDDMTFIDLVAAFNDSAGQDAVVAMMEKARHIL